MKNRFISLGTILLMLGSLSWSCVDYLDQFNMDRLSTELEVSPSIAAPVAYGSFSIQDILEAVGDSSGLISQTDDSLIYIYFSDTAFTFAAGEFLEVPDQVAADIEFQAGIDIPEFDGLFEDEQYTIEKYEKIEFATESDDRIDSVTLKAGNLNMELFSELRHHGTINIQSSNIITDQGDPLNLDFTISEPDGLYDHIEVIDLTGYKFVLSQVNDSTVIELDFELTFTKSSAGVSADEKTGIDISITDIQFGGIYGFIGEREVANLDESIDLDFFDDIEGLPDFYFADPRISIMVHNSYGVPLSLNVDTLSVRSADDGTYTYLDFVGDNNIFEVAAPTIDQLGESVTSVWDINTETSNIDDLLSNVPDQISLSVLATIGSPEGSTEQSFFLDTSKMVLESEVTLPLWFSTTGYTLNDTLDIDVAEIMSNIDFINAIDFRLVTVNEWPLQLAAQIHFLDDDGQMVGSLFEEQMTLIDAAPVDGDGELDRSLLEPYTLPITLENEDLTGLKDATRMMLEVKVATSGDGTIPVKFFSNYLLDYKMSLAIDFRINPAELDF